MRSPKWNELVVGLFALYMFFTLTVEPELFTRLSGEEPTPVYETYIAMVGTQQNLAYISLGVGILTFFTLFTEKFWFNMSVYIVGLIYYFFITASFLINYPNIAFGVMSLVSVGLFMEMIKYIDETENLKKNMIMNGEEYDYIKKKDQKRIE